MRFGHDHTLMTDETPPWRSRGKCLYVVVCAKSWEIAPCTRVIDARMIAA